MSNFLLNLAVSLVGGGNVNVPSLNADQVLQNGLNIAYSLAGTIAIIVIIIGGVIYTTSAGNAANITKAKNMVFYSVIGLVVVIFAYAITNYVILRFK